MLSKPSSAALPRSPLTSSELTVGLAEELVLPARTVREEFVFAAPPIAERDPVDKFFFSRPPPTAAARGAVLDGSAFREKGALHGLSEENQTRAREFAFVSLASDRTPAAVAELGRHLNRIPLDSPDLEKTISALAASKAGTLLMLRSLATRPELRLDVVSALNDSLHATGTRGRFGERLEDLRWTPIVGQF